MPSLAILKWLLCQLTVHEYVAKCQLTTCGYGNRKLTECGYGPRQQLTRCEYEADIGRGQTHSGSPSPLRMCSVEAYHEISKAGCKDGCLCKGLHDALIRS